MKDKFQKCFQEKENSENKYHYVFAYFDFTYSILSAALVQADFEGLQEEVKKHKIHQANLEEQIKVLKSEVQRLEKSATFNLPSEVLET